jgi:hypothetical protein
MGNFSKTSMFRGLLLLALNTSVFAAAPTFCKPAELTVFSCRTGAKMVSVCAAKNASKRKGFLQYRFGKPSAKAPIELLLPEAEMLAADAATGESVPFAGGGGVWLRFSKGAYAYVVYSGIGKWGANGATAEKHGLIVEHNGKTISNLPCTGTLTSTLGPDWLEQMGITSHAQIFDFPE